MDINVRKGSKFENINGNTININDVTINDEDNVLNSDNCSVKLIGGMIIKTFEVTYKPPTSTENWYIEKEYKFKTPFPNQCTAVFGGAISNNDRNCLIVNATPKTKESCLLSVRHANKVQLKGDITMKMCAIGY